MALFYYYFFVFVSVLKCEKFISIVCSFLIKFPIFRIDINANGNRQKNSKWQYSSANNLRKLSFIGWYPQFSLICKQSIHCTYVTHVSLLIITYSYATENVTSFTELNVLITAFTNFLNCFDKWVVRTNLFSPIRLWITTQMHCIYRIKLFQIDSLLNDTNEITRKHTVLVAKCKCQYTQMKWMSNVTEWYMLRPLSLKYNMSRNIDSAKSKVFFLFNSICSYVPLYNAWNNVRHTHICRWQYVPISVCVFPTFARHFKHTCIGRTDDFGCCACTISTVACRGMRACVCVKVEASQIYSRSNTIDSVYSTQEIARSCLLTYGCIQHINIDEWLGLHSMYFFIVVIIVMSNIHSVGQ